LDSVSFNVSLRQFIYLHKYLSGNFVRLLISLTGKPRRRRKKAMECVRMGRARLLRREKKTAPSAPSLLSYGQGEPREFLRRPSCLHATVKIQFY